jgi:hypothetical protein
VRVCLVAIVCMLSFTANTFATDQVSDRLIHNGRAYRLISHPLEIFFRRHPKRFPFGGVISTALSRGHLATYEIRDSLLWVNDIKVETLRYDSLGNRILGWRSVLRETFPDTIERFCGYYTGLLILPYGAVLGVPGAGPPPSERYRLVHVSKGRMIGEKELSKEGYFDFKKRQFQKFQKTREYKKHYRKCRKHGFSDTEAETFFWIYDMLYAEFYLMDEI